MKELISCFVSLLFFTLLFAVKTVYAEDTDLLNLSAYSKGEILPYGENIVVGQDEKTGVKWVTAGADEKNEGKMKFPVNLSGDFDLVIKIKSNISNKDKTLFLTADEYQIKLAFSKNLVPLLRVGEDTATDESRAYKADVTNVIKLSVKGNVVKLYINDVFSQKLTLTPNLTYTQLLFNGLYVASYGEDQLLELSLTGNGGSTQHPVTGSGDFDSGKQAGIQQCVSDPASCGISVTGGTCTGTHATYNPSAGEVHIPLIDVPGPFGGTQTYEVYLKQQPLTFTFDLDLERIILK